MENGEQQWENHRTTMEEWENDGKTREKLWENWKTRGKPCREIEVYPLVINIAMKDQQI